MNEPELSALSPKQKGLIERFEAGQPLALSRIISLVENHGSGFEAVLEALHGVDDVAYVRFASVYRNFQDAGEFQEFVDEMTAAQQQEELRRNQVELPLER